MIRILLLALVLTGCGWMKQTTEVGDNSSAVVNQQQDRAAGAKVQATNVEEVVTNNVTGVNPLYALLGGLAIGVVIRQPYWARFIW